VPKYGGRFILALDTAPTAFDDDLTGSPGFAYTMNLTNETLQTGDWARGPAGTNEYDFWFSAIVPKYDTGWLAESWEAPDPNTVIFHIRHGVNWGLNNQSEASRLVNGRELTANDVAATIIRDNTVVLGNIHRNEPNWIESVTATDKYTVTIKCHDTPAIRTGQALVEVNDKNIIAPEIIQKYGDLSDWKNSCGTGPFMLVDCVPGASYTFDRNPNYWAKDPVGPGKGNQLPYLDGVTYLQIPDKTTQTAGLRTSKIDWLNNISLNIADNLKSTNPELKYKQQYNTNDMILAGREDDATLPFKDLKVRQALLMAIDKESIKSQLYGGQAEILSYPAPPSFKDVYTPLDQLPATTKEPFTYNPDKAKQLLAAAGYPNGFKTTILTSNDSNYIDLLTVVQANWAKIGVTLQLDARDYTTFKTLQSGHQYKEMVIWANSLGSHQKFISTIPVYTWNLPIINDPLINDIRSQVYMWENLTNQAKQDQLVKTGMLQELAQLYYLPLPAPYIYTFWQPWLKNYHGEYCVGYLHYFNFSRWIWIDQNAKKSAGH
jgi:ABC-type transport system substrate-binding protein